MGTFLLQLRNRPNLPILKSQLGVMVFAADVTSGVEFLELQFILAGGISPLLSSPSLSRIYGGVGMGARGEWVQIPTFWRTPILSLV